MCLIFRCAINTRNYGNVFFSTIVRGWCTCEHAPPLALLLHATVLLSRQRVRRLKDEAADVVALLEIGLLLWRLLLFEVWLDKGHLDVGKLGVQVFGVHLRQSKTAPELM